MKLAQLRANASDQPKEAEKPTRLDSSLRAAAMKLYKANRAEKAAKTRKEEARNKFFSLATEKVRKTRTLGEKQLLLTHEPDGLTPEQQVTRDYPGWTVTEFEVLDTDGETGAVDVRVTIKEDPTLAKYSFEHPDGFKVGRTYEERGAYFRTEDFAKEQPELARRCVTVEVVSSYEAGWKWTEGETGDNPVEGFYTMELRFVLDEAKAKKIRSKEPETLPIFQRYAVPGKITAKLTPISEPKKD